MANSDRLIKDQLAASNEKQREITKELQTSFLDYAMSVIVARAIPDARDGFKPVHRRVLFAAWNLGMTSNSQYKKSARLVGEVIGKYHPHGDVAVYDTMVRLAQDFSLRYPLIDGHGNFGSIDGDSAAAMRYTEARMAKLADTMLVGIDKETVDFTDNYDASEKEPVVLPAIFPNLLANGSSGIAVGIATNIPPHNLKEIIGGIKVVAKNPSATCEEIMQVLKGPDFPTAAQIIGTQGIKDYFSTGKGSITVRAKVDIEHLDGGKSRLIVKEIPYMVNKQQLVEKITELVKNDEINGITDLRDESNHLGIRIVIELKRGIIPEILLNNLFKMTKLQTNFAVNMLALVGAEPKMLNIKSALQIYIDHQIDVLARKTKFNLKIAQNRLHILNGLLIALKNINAIIKLIRNAPSDKAILEALTDKYQLSSVQAKAILEMKLRSLSMMEKTKIVNEVDKLNNDIKKYNDLLNSHDQQIDFIIHQLDELAKKFGDERKTEIVVDGIASINNEDLIPVEDIVITMSINGYLKRMPINTFRNQKRGGIGVTAMQVHSDDNVMKLVTANTHTDILIFTNYGKVYRLRGHEIPVGSRQAKGVPAINFLQIEKNEKIVTILPIKEYSPNLSLMFATSKGIVKKTALVEYQHINKTGKIAISLKDEDKLFDVKLVSDNDEVYLGNATGKLVRFKANQIRNMGRTATGVRGIKIDQGYLVGFSTSYLGGSKILSIGEKGIGKISDVNLYRLTNRGSKGVTTLKITPKTGKLVYTTIVSGNEDILLLTKKGNVLKTNLTQFSDRGRAISGVKLIVVEQDDKIVSAAVFAQPTND